MDTPSILDVLPPELILKIAQSIEVDDHLTFKLTCKAFSTFQPTPLSEAMVQAYPDSPPRASYVYSGLPTDVPARKHWWHLNFRKDKGYWSQHDVNSSGRDHAKCWAIKAHARFEKSTSKAQFAKLASLLCTCCGKIRERKSFVDAQARARVDLKEHDDLSKPINRTCITCGVEDKSFNYCARFPLTIGGERKFVCFCCEEVRDASDGKAVPILTDESFVTMRACSGCYQKAFDAGWVEIDPPFGEWNAATYEDYGDDRIIKPRLRSAKAFPNSRAPRRCEPNQCTLCGVSD